MQDSDVKALKDRILAEGLKGYSLEDIFRGLCETISVHFSLYRASIGMPTLHPLVEAKSIKWTKENGLDIIHSEHGYSEQDDWLNSPISYMFEHKLEELRCPLSQPGLWQRFPLLIELSEAGCTEYFVSAVSFSDVFYPSKDDTEGMLVSWSTQDSDGFSDSFFKILGELLPALGIVSKLADRQSTAVNIVEAYLGKDAGKRVLKGQIERGELISIEAVVWYSDLRRSTWLAENLSNQAFLDTLNTYFECTAGSVLDYQGEVLRFIGDAVLAIFPIESFENSRHAAQSAWNAANQARRRIEDINSTRKKSGLIPLDFGLALHAGSLDYGNIGVASRLEFSVIGTVANEVARLEELTKQLKESILVSESFANLISVNWKCLGPQQMKGVKNRPLVYAPGQ